MCLLDNADQATITELNKYKRLKGCLYSFYDSYKRVAILDRINLQIGWIQQGMLFSDRYLYRASGRAGFLQLERR